MCNIWGSSTCDQPPVAHAFPNWPLSLGLANWLHTHNEMQHSKFEESGVFQELAGQVKALKQNIHHDTSSP